jgi:hypothetical protein
MVPISPQGHHDCPPETLVRWHRAGFRRYWRWKSRSFGGRPQIDADLRALIRRMSVDNPLWGAPRIHGELLKLGFEVTQSSVAKYMVKRYGPPSPGWSSFLRNHAPDIAAMDLLLLQPLASTCSMFSSSFDWSDENLSGSTSHAIRNGLHARLQRLPRAQRAKARRSPSRPRASGDPYSRCGGYGSPLARGQLLQGFPRWMTCGQDHDPTNACSESRLKRRARGELSGLSTACGRLRGERPPEPSSQLLRSALCFRGRRHRAHILSGDPPRVLAR